MTRSSRDPRALLVRLAASLAVLTLLFAGWLIATHAQPGQDPTSLIAVDSISADKSWSPNTTYTVTVVFTNPADAAGVKTALMEYNEDGYLPVYWPLILGAAPDSMNAKSMVMKFRPYSPTARGTGSGTRGTGKGTIIVTEPDPADLTKLKDYELDKSFNLSSSHHGSRY